MRVLLSGGTGLIGRALCDQWRLQGHDLIVWSRKPAQVSALCGEACGVWRGSRSWAISSWMRW